MGLKVLSLALGLFLCIEIQASPRRQSTEEAARDFVYRSSDQLFHFYDIIKERNFPSDYGFFEGIDQVPVYREMCRRVADIAKEARSFSRELIQNPEVKKELTILSNAGLLALEDEYFDKFLDSVTSLENLATEQILCSYHHKDYCELAYIPEIRRVLSQSHDSHELKHYWEEWRNKQSTAARVQLERYVDAFRNASQINEKTPMDLWYDNYEDPNFLATMEDVMKQLKPFYSTFHAYVRYVLNKKYGELVVSQNGPIPHHLIEQIMAQAWKKNSLLEHPYPDKKLPNLKEQLDQHGFNARKIVEVADDFFRSMGFPALPQTFWTNNTKPKSKEQYGVDCKAEVFDSTPNVALKYCPKTNFKKFLQIHGDMARLHYANQKRGLPITFFDSYDFEFAVGEAVILSASTPKHMQRIGLLRNYMYDEHLSMNRLFRLGLHTMFNIPLHFVQSKIMAEMLLGQIGLDQTNERYWQLMEEYAGIEPPTDRAAHHIDFSYKFYEDMNENHQTKKFVNEILGYQFYRALCKISGGYARGTSNQPLQNCDFYGSYEAGDSLRRMMSLGSKKPWRDVLGGLIEDESDINAAALLEFYEPLKHWLESQNNLFNVQVGWTPNKYSKLVNFDDLMPAY